MHLNRLEEEIRVTTLPHCFSASKSTIPESDARVLGLLHPGQGQKYSSQFPEECPSYQPTCWMEICLSLAGEAGPLSSQDARFMEPEGQPGRRSVSSARGKENAFILAFEEP